MDQSSGWKQIKKQKKSSKNKPICKYSLVKYTTSDLKTPFGFQCVQCRLCHNIIHQNIKFSTDKINEYIETVNRIYQQLFDENENFILTQNKKAYVIQITPIHHHENISNITLKLLRTTIKYIEEEIKISCRFFYWSSKKSYPVKEDPDAKEHPHIVIDLQENKDFYNNMFNIQNGIFAVDYKCIPDP